MTARTYKLYCRGAAGTPDVMTSFPSSMGDEFAIRHAKEISLVLGKNGLYYEFLLSDITDGVKNQRRLAAWEVVTALTTRDLK